MKTLIATLLGIVMFVYLRAETVVTCAVYDLKGSMAIADQGALMYLGKAYEYLEKDIDSAQMFINKSFQVPIVSETILVELYLLQSEIYRRRGDHKSAFYYSSLANRKAETDRLNTVVNQTRCSLIKDFNESGQVDSVIIYAGMVIADTNACIYEKLKAANYLSTSYFLTGNTDTAIRELNRIKHIYEHLNDTTGLIETHISLASGYTKTNLPDSSVYHLQRALSLSLEARDEIMQARIYYEIGLLYATEGNTIQSRYYLEKSVTICFRESLYELLVLNYHAYIRAELESDKPDSSQVSFYINGINMYVDSVKNPLTKVLVFGVARDACVRENNYILAMEYSTRIEGVYRSLYDDWVASAVSRYKYSGALQNMDVLLGKLKRQNQALKVRFRHSVILSILLALALLLLSEKLFFSVIRRKIKQKRNNLSVSIEGHLENLENQRELGEALMNVRFANTLGKAVEELKKIELFCDKSRQEDVRNVIHLISSACNTGLQDRFLDQFSYLYPGFEKELLERHSSLTNNDIKMCMLMRLNLNTKEIADILGQSARTVESARYRIRKKMNMDQDENLNVYLMSI